MFLQSSDICILHVICLNNLRNCLGNRLSNLCLNNNDSLITQYVDRSVDTQANNLKNKKDNR